MVQINGKFLLDIYDLDTQQSAIQRIAAKLKTIPRYLYFPDGKPTMDDLSQQDSNITARDLLVIIKSPVFGTDFIKLYEKIKDQIEENGLGLRQDVLIPFIVYRKGIPEGYEEPILLNIQTELDKSNIFGNDEHNDVLKIWENKELYKKDIDTSIESISKKAEEQEKIFKQFSRVSATLPYTKFELERTTFQFELDMNHITLMEIFNHIQLNSLVPFASVNNIYKILKDFIPPPDWKQTLDDAILVRVLQKQDVAASKYTDYTDALLTIDGDPGKEIIIVGMRLFTSRQYLSRERMIERFTNIIKGLGDISIKNLTETKVNGVFYFPKLTLDKYVLSDMIMNNTLFSSMMSVDESSKASKKKDSVYIHFRNPIIGDLTANILEKTAVKNDPDLIGKNILTDFLLGSQYIRVRISSAENLKSVKDFQNTFSKLLVIYNNNFNNIVNIYRQYIPDFAIRAPQKVPEIKTLRLKDIAPEVFVANYPTKCAHPPEIVDDDQAEELVKSGKKIMRYPISEEEGFIPRNYVCKKPTFPYPGLKENTLANKDLIPYLPCCYATDHDVAGKNNPYRRYYYGDTATNIKETQQQQLITTNKFVGKDKFGTLPQSIKKLFENIEYNENYTYVRKGVYDTKNSFIDCVIEGVTEKSIKKATETTDIRKEFSKKAKYSSLCRQQMYEFSIEEIQSILEQTDIYFNPLFFINLLEKVYKCNIYIFSRKKNDNANAELVLPRHLQSLYTDQNNYKSIFIYQHWGSKADAATYPRCELIVRWETGTKGEDAVSYNFDKDSSISQGTKIIYNQLRTAYALNTQIPEINFPLLKNNSSIKFIGQGIDSYGKTRMIRFEYKGETGTVFVSPIPSLYLNEIKNWTVTKLTRENALEFIEKVGITVTKQSIFNNIIKELQGFLGNVNISIPIYDSQPINAIPTTDIDTGYPESKSSIIDDYNTYKKLARYMSEYTYWLFSKYLNDNNISNISTEEIEKFVRERIKIKPSFQYGYVGKTFSMDNGLMEGGQLVVKSNDSLRRLIYTLRLFIRRYRRKLLEYYNRKVIENYYVDITDFDQHQFQIILQGDESVEKWIQEKKIKYNLYNEVQLSSFLPYFFQNTLIGPEIYLAQNTPTIKNAISISQAWQLIGYNPGPDYNITLIQEPVYTLYRYVNEEDITPFTVQGAQTNFDIRILGYKLEDGATFFTALLKL